MPFAAAIRIMRPLNCLITFVSVLLGGWLGAHTLPPALLAAGLAAAAITGAGNALNDIVDIRRDRVNRPDRPLPSGKLSVGTAAFLTAALFGFGLVLALRLPASATALAILAVAGLVLYNLRLKDVPLAGNLTVSLLGGTAFLFGAASVGSYQPALVVAGFACLYHFGREILKDVADKAGDQDAGGDTVPIRWGLRSALIGVCAAYTILILASPLPFILDLYGLPYLGTILVLDGFLIWVMLHLWRSPDPGRFARLSRLLKIGMFLGLGAIFFGAQ
jgi:geranylgeranylglycerol-phosphate geranylgeranyltransferase